MKRPDRFPPAQSIDEITPEAVTERLSYRLQKLIGSGRRWSYFGVASRSGIDVRTLKAYVQGTACPNLVKYKRLLAVLGPEIGIELNIMKGWLPRSEVVPPEALDLSDLRQELIRAVGVLGEVLGRAGDAGNAGGTGPADDEVEAMTAPDDDPVQTHPEFRAPLRVEDIDVKAVALRLGYRLNKIVGPGRAWSLADLSDATGIDRRTLQSYLDGVACPNLARYHRLGHVLGPQVGVELAYMIGWEPRFSQATRLPRAATGDLYLSLRDALGAIDRFAVGGAARSIPVRFIRPNDRVADGTAQAPLQPTGLEDDLVD